MRPARSAFLLSVTFLISILVAAQPPPQRDPQAAALLQRAVVAMGVAAPNDSVATGKVVLVAGGKTDQGTIRLLTRGVGQSAELLDTTGGTRALIISGEWGTERQGTTSRKLPLEAVLSNQAPAFPLPFLVSALTHRDTAFALVGQETLDGSPVYHVRLWNTFASNPDLQPLAGFSVKDLWLDAASGLPRRLACERQDGAGAVARIPIEVTYSDYRNVGGILYPFRIEKSLNGTPWATITIQSIAFNTGLTDADFPVR